MITKRATLWIAPNITEQLDKNKMNDPYKNQEVLSSETIPKVASRATPDFKEDYPSTDSGQLKSLD